MRPFDVHQHIGYLTSGRMPEIREDMEKRIEVMDMFGIESAAIMPSSGYYMPNGISDTKKVNEMMADYKSKNPLRFPYAIGTVEPRHGSESLKEIERLINELKLDGIVWHHRFQGTTIDHEMTKLYLNKISDLNSSFPVFIHNFCESTFEASWRLESLAIAFPNLTFISLSSLSSPDNINKMLLLAKRQSNVLLETGMLFPLSNVIERLVKEIGSQRVIFGSDTYSDPAATEPWVPLEVIRRSKISDEDKKNILEKNAGTLFGLKST